jgi:hypothetical protein
MKVNDWHIKKQSQDYLALLVTTRGQCIFSAEIGRFARLERRPPRATQARLFLTVTFPGMLFDLVENCFN